MSKNTPRWAHVTSNKLFGVRGELGGNMWVEKIRYANQFATVYMGGTRLARSDILF